MRTKEDNFVSRNEHIELRQRVVALTWVVGLVVALVLGSLGGRTGAVGVGYGFPPVKTSAPVSDPEPEARLGPHHGGLPHGEGPPHGGQVEDGLLAEHVREAVDEAREFAAISLAQP